MDVIIDGEHVDKLLTMQVNWVKTIMRITSKVKTYMFVELAVAKERSKTVLQNQTSTAGASRHSARETQGKYSSRFKDFVMN